MKINSITKLSLIFAFAIIAALPIKAKDYIQKNGKTNISVSPKSEDYCLEGEGTHTHIGDRNATIAIAMNNLNAISAFQCDIYLPEHSSVTFDEEEDEYSFVLAPERKTSSHTIVSNYLGDGHFRIMCASSKSANLKLNAGTLFTINLDIDESIVAGNYEIRISDILLYENDGHTFHTAGDISVPLIVEGDTPQDVLATAISVDIKEMKMNQECRMQLFATVEPADAIQQVKWQSSNVEVVTVDDLGRIKAIAPGEATITATTTDGSNLSASCEVAVLENGDMNADRIVDVTDVTLLINKIIR